MKNYILLTLTIFSFLIISCKKDKACELNETGDVNIDNQSPDDYKFIINMDSTFIIASGSETTLTLPVGDYDFNAETQGPLMGIASPIGWGTKTLTPCDEVNLVINQ